MKVDERQSSANKGRGREVSVSVFPKDGCLGHIFLNRDKNQDALAALGIAPRERERYVREIGVDDYVETIISAMGMGDMWVFGRDVNKREVYVKISLGFPNDKTICISFHEAENRIKYAFKDKEDKL